MGDGRNVLEIAALQRPLVGKPSSSGFQQMFNDTITSVGASLRANETSLEAAEAIMEASVEAESAYSELTSIPKLPTNRTTTGLSGFGTSFANRQRALSDANGCSLR